jgi:succinate dehydrogenase/fumarate reductase cytochrome b subunit
VVNLVLSNEPVAAYRTAVTRLERAAPALAAILYPALIWAGPALSPLFLALAAIVPALGVVGAHRAGRSYRRTRAVALVAVAVPPLYSWLGGLLDFQSVVPVRALGVWFPMWAALALAAVSDRPTAANPARSRPAGLAFAHGCSGAIIAIFGVAHVANHITALWGGQRHIALMTTLRVVYRLPAVEAVLLAAVAFQVCTGLMLLRRAAERDGSWWSTAQVTSGAYMAGFFVSHLTAALRARWLRGVDTNWLWLTADSMLSDPWSARLAPYYALSVVALGVHAGLGLRYVMRARGWTPAAADRIGIVVPMTSTAASALIMTALLWR